MTNENAPFEFIALIVAIALFTSGMGLGSVVSETGNITGGRNDGIVFCSEKPKECAVEYSYIKIKEARK